MEDYQKRVINEHCLLEEKANALYEFLDSKQFDTLDKVDQTLLRQQYYSMMAYLGILTKRIERF